MPFTPRAKNPFQTNLSEQFAAPGLWRHSIPSIADQVKAIKAANVWRDQPIPLDFLMSLDTIPLYNDLDRTDNAHLIPFARDSRPRYKQRARILCR